MIKPPRWGRLMGLGAAVVFVLAIVAPACAQEPTPLPSPTPIVTGQYIVHQTVTYGEAGVIVSVLFLAGVVLLQLMVHLGERVTDR